MARVFIGRQADPNPQIRDHSNIARASAALGTGGFEEVKALLLQVAPDGGFADASILSSDTTAQELPISIPTNPGAYGGGAQRCGRALAKLKTWAVVGVDTALAQVQTLLRTVKEHPLCQGHTGQAPGVDAFTHRGGAVDRADTPAGPGLGSRRARVTQHALTTSCRPCTRWPSGSSHRSCRGSPLA